jgi:hypothetical protein
MRLELVTVRFDAENQSCYRIHLSPCNCNKLEALLVSESHATTNETRCLFKLRGPMLWNCRLSDVFGNLLESNAM